MTKKRPFLACTLLLASMFGSATATEIVDNTHHDVSYHYSEDDGIVGWRVVVDGKPCIPYTLWKQLHKHFSSEVAKAVCEDLPLIDYRDVDGLTFADASDLEDAESGELCVYVQRGEWTERVHLRCREEYADYTIYVGHFIDKL